MSNSIVISSVVEKSSQQSSWRLILGVHVIKCVHLVFSVFFIAGCQGSTNYQNLKKPPVLIKAEKAWLNENGREAARLYTKFILAHPQSLYVSDAYYHLGLQAHHNQEFDRARRDLSEAVRRARDQQMQALALMALASAWEEDSALPMRHRTQEAQEIYLELWESHRSIIAGDEILFSLGESALVLSQKDKAVQWFRQLLKNYPRSERVKEIKERGLTKIRDLSVQVGAFKDLKNAREFMSRLRRDGFTPFLVQKKLYLVRVGKFKTYEAARQLAERLENLNYPAFLVP